jgi:hypothetical protein
MTHVNLNCRMTVEVNEMKLLKYLMDYQAEDGAVTGDE